MRAQKLKAGECQITLNPRPADLDALKKDPNLNLPSQAGFNLGYIAYNVTHKPFDKPATGGIRRCPGEPADNRKRSFALRIGLLACPPSGRASLLDACRRSSPGKLKQEAKASTTSSLSSKHEARSSVRSRVLYPAEL